ncbi:Pdp3-interacting factor 1 [Savitreella phatthalungensis]
MATTTRPKELGDGTVKHHKPFIVFSDFDGTITLQDSNDYMTDNVGFGKERRVHLNQEVLHDRMSFRDSFDEMLASVKLPFDECKQLLLDNIRLDPGFKTFFEWCRSKDIPVVVLSSGMKPIIRALLTKLVGDAASEIDIVANDVDVDEKTGEWKILFHDDSHFGHDKSLAIRPYAALPEGERPKMVYCGDGVSDLSAARETDLLFAKEGRDLVTYCVKEGMPFTEFDSFADIHRACEQLHSGQVTLEKLAAQSKTEYEQKHA